VLTVRRTTAKGTTTSAFAISTGDAVVARSPLTGTELWRRPDAGATVLGSGPDAVYLLTGPAGARNLVTLDPSTGAVRASFPPAAGTEKTDWVPGRWQVADGFVAVERMSTDGDPDHYFTVETVVIAAVP
jgi:hypothetical protein